VTKSLNEIARRPLSHAGVRRLAYIGRVIWQSMGKPEDYDRESAVRAALKQFAEEAESAGAE
jgi:hypothetical protein